MAKPVNADKEIWESTIPGRISVQVQNSQGRPQTISIVGKGSRLRVTEDERLLVQEGVRHEQNDPFTNGMLIMMNRKDGAAADDELNDEQLGTLFELTGEDFENAVRALSEVNIRRLKSMVVEKDAARSQMEFLDELIEERWPIGSDTPSNAEARGDKATTVTNL